MPHQVKDYQHLDANYMKYLIILISVFFNLKSAFSQKWTVKDTIYYLVDTAKVPIKDRLVETGVEVNNIVSEHRIDTAKYFRINCGCLPYDHDIVFLRTKVLPVQISKKELSKIHLIDLSHLLRLVLKEYKKGFNENHQMVMVEVVKGKFYARPVYLTEYSGPTTN